MSDEKNNEVGGMAKEKPRDMQGELVADRLRRCESDLGAYRKLLDGIRFDDSDLCLLGVYGKASVMETDDRIEVWLGDGFPLMVQKGDDAAARDTLKACFALASAYNAMLYLRAKVKEYGIPTPSHMCELVSIASKGKETMWSASNERACMEEMMESALSDECGIDEMKKAIDEAGAEKMAEIEVLRRDFNRKALEADLAFDADRDAELARAIAEAVGEDLGKDEREESASASAKVKGEEGTRCGKAGRVVEFSGGLFERCHEILGDGFTPLEMEYDEETKGTRIWHGPHRTPFYALLLEYVNAHYKYRSPTRFPLALRWTPGGIGGKGSVMKWVTKEMTKEGDVVERPLERGEVTWIVESFTDWYVQGAIGRGLLK